MRQSKIIFVLLFFLVTTAGASGVTDAAELLDEYAARAKRENPTFKGFSPSSGEKFYFLEGKDRSGNQISCATCHSSDSRKEGRTRANKVILPMAIAVNPKRFTDRSKTEKWFLRNCKDVFQRECTAQEKGDFISYLKSINR